MGNVGMWSMDGSQNETEIFLRLVALPPQSLIKRLFYSAFAELWVVI